MVLISRFDSGVRGEVERGVGTGNDSVAGRMGRRMEGAGDPRGGERGGHGRRGVQWSGVGFCKDWAHADLWQTGCKGSCFFVVCKGHPVFQVNSENGWPVVSLMHFGFQEPAWLDQSSVGLGGSRREGGSRPERRRVTLRQVIVRTPSIPSDPRHCTAPHPRTAPLYPLKNPSDCCVSGRLRNWRRRRHSVRIINNSVI